MTGAVSQSYPSLKYILDVNQPKKESLPKAGFKNKVRCLISEREAALIKR